MNKVETILLDSCSLINLINGNHLDSVLAIKKYKFILSQLVYRELSKINAQKMIVDEKISDAKIILFTGHINLTDLSRLYSQYHLGDGETESISICLNNSYLLCCDDKKARASAQKEIKSSNVLGSLRLLKIAVMEEIIKCKEAEIGYLEMILKGGFLPKKVEQNYFCTDL